MWYFIGENYRQTSFREALDYFAFQRLFVQVGLFEWLGGLFIEIKGLFKLCLFRWMHLGGLFNR